MSLGVLTGPIVRTPTHRRISHAVLATAGVSVTMSDLFGVGGRQLLASAALASEPRARVE